MFGWFSSSAPEDEKKNSEESFEIVPSNGVVDFLKKLSQYCDTFEVELNKQFKEILDESVYEKMMDQSNPEIVTGTELLLKVSDEAMNARNRMAAYLTENPEEITIERAEFAIKRGDDLLGSIFELEHKALEHHQKIESHQAISTKDFADAQAETIRKWKEYKVPALELNEIRQENESDEDFQRRVLKETQRLQAIDRAKFLISLADEALERLPLNRKLTMGKAFYYKNSLRLLKELKELSNSVQPLVPHLFNILERGTGGTRELLSTLWRLPRDEILKQLVDLRDKLAAFQDSLARLDISNIPVKFPDSENLLKLLNFLIPTKKISEQVNSNQIVKTVKKHFQQNEIKEVHEHKRHVQGHIDPLKTIIANLDGWAQHLSKVLMDLSATQDVAEKANKSILETVGKLQFITNQIAEFSKTEKSLLDTLAFVYRVHGSAMSLLNNFPQAFVSVKSVFLDHFLASMQQFNLIFMELALHTDRIEMEFYLKDGYLKTFAINDHSLLSSFKAFNDLMEKFGYQFKPEERFPYTKAILDQREKILANEAKAIVPQLTTKLVEKRVKKASDQLKQHDAEEIKQWALSQDNYLENRKNLINAVISLRTSELASERNSVIKAKKQSLLTALQKELNHHDSFGKALAALSQKAQYKNDIHLLFEGRTLDTIKKVQGMTVKPGARLDVIDLALTDLKKQRYVSFFSKSKPKAFEEQVAALEYLRGLLSTPGYRVSQAIDTMNARKPEHFHTLNQLRPELLKELAEIDSQIPNHLMGKIILDYLNKPAPQAERKEEKYVEPQAQSRELFITAQIHILNEELTKWNTRLFYCLIGEPKNHKKELLTELKIILNSSPSMTLDKGLDELAKNPLHRPYLYLLNEGRTGKLLHKLLLQEMPLEKVVRKIEIEIVRLNRDLNTPLYFFAKLRKHKIEEQIQALETLTRRLQTGGSMEEAFNSLTPKEQSVLNKNFSDLIESLRNWTPAAERNPRP